LLLLRNQLYLFVHKHKVQANFFLVFLNPLPTQFFPISNLLNLIDFTRTSKIHKAHYSLAEAFYILEVFFSLSLFFLCFLSSYLFWYFLVFLLFSYFYVFSLLLISITLFQNH
jgi:hypothetical protein